MKKVGLVTIIDYKNYGNRLQNFAAQQVLESLGCDVVTLLNNPYKNIVHKRSIMERLKGKSFFDIVQAINNRIKKIKTNSINIEKEKALKEFSYININESDFILSADSIPENLGERFGYFVVGSDQVWNPTFRNGSCIDFLTFAPQNKRIAYAPSFGISEIPIEYHKDYKKWLSEFSNLSVREDAGAKIIKDLTGRNAIVLIDPTLMLSKEEWLNVSKPSLLKPDKPFILTYFLGELSKETKGFIKSLSKDDNLEIVNLGNYKDIKRYATSPSEFIDYINSSSIFLTDSFHGVVFSILMEKPFVVFDRIGNIPSMNSRIDTILGKFNLTKRKFNHAKTPSDYLEIDYSHVPSILERERQRTIDYLKEALNIKDEN